MSSQSRSDMVQSQPCDDDAMAESAPRIGWVSALMLIKCTLNSKIHRRPSSTCLLFEIYALQAWALG
jgi:hypothetical protein